MTKIGHGNLSKVAARGGIQTVGGQAIRTGIQLLNLIILARLLSPEEFGLAAMVTAITALAALLGDFGLSLAAAQARELSDDQRTNLFWVNTGLGVVLAATVFFAAPAFEIFYGRSEIADIARWLSITFVFSGAAAQYRAGLMRSMRFGAVASIDTIAQAVSFGVICTMAFCGAGYWAIVGGSLALPLVTLVLASIQGGWLPRFPNAKGSIRTFASFGAGTMFTQLLNSASVNVGPVALGKHFGPETVGLYNRGYQIFAVALQQLAGPLTSVAVPVLSKLRDKPLAFASFAATAQRTLSWVLGAATCAVAIGGPSLVGFLMGSNWIDSGQIVRILALGGIFQILGYANYWIFLAHARMKVLLICEGSVRVLMIPVIFVASTISIQAAAAAFSFCLFAVWVSSTFIGLRKVNVSPWQQTRASVLPLIVFGFIYAITRILQETAFADEGDMVTLAGSFGAALALAGLSLFVPAIRLELFGILDMARNARKNGGTRGRKNS